MKMYYDPEYDRIIDEKEVRRQYDWFQKNQDGFCKTFEQFASENFTSEDECDITQLVGSEWF